MTIPYYMTGEADHWREFDELKAENKKLRAEKASFCEGYRMIVDEQTKALHTKIEMMEAELAEANKLADHWAEQYLSIAIAQEKDK